MKQQIDHLIANTLLDEEMVYLPNIGTLTLYRHPAKRLSAKKMQRPYRELRFKAEEQGVSIILLISKVANVSEERAEDIYAEWLAQSHREATTTIEGVCLIKNGVVSTNETFETMVNPDGRGVVKMQPRSNRLIYIIVVSCLVIALGVAALLLYSNGTFDSLLGKDKSKTAETATNVQTEETTTNGTSTSAATSEVSDTDTTASEEGVILIETTTTPSAEQVTEQVVEQESTAITSLPTEPIEEPAMPSLQKGKSYAVWGVYDKLKNAERYLTWLAQKYPKVEAKIYLYDSRYMVALCEAPSRKACNKTVAAWKKRYKGFKDVWVYTR